MLRGKDIVPLYQQLEDIIQAQIETGELKPGEQVPPEILLADQYNVSRITIRQTLADLVKKGLLFRKQGKGTFVATPKIERELISVHSFSERMRSKGYIPGSKVLSIKLTLATPNVRKYLELGEGEQVIAIERLRLSNQEPIVLENSFISYSAYPLVLEADINIGSLYQFLKEKYNVAPTISKKTLEITVANEYEAKLLKIYPGQPLFLLRALVMTDDKRPVEYVKTLLRGDRVKFQI
jgi:GntR family transcriptional regulator